MRRSSLLFLGLLIGALGIPSAARAQDRDDVKKLKSELDQLMSKVKDVEAKIARSAEKAGDERGRPDAQRRGPEGRGAEGRGPMARGPEGRGPGGRPFPGGPFGEMSPERAKEMRERFEKMRAEGKGPLARPEGRGFEGRGPMARGPEAKDRPEAKGRPEAKARPEAKGQDLREQFRKKTDLGTARREESRRGPQGPWAHMTPRGGKFAKPGEMAHRGGPAPSKHSAGKHSAGKHSAGKHSAGKHSAMASRGPGPMHGPWAHRGPQARHHGPAQHGHHGQQARSGSHGRAPQHAMQGGRSPWGPWAHRGPSGHGNWGRSDWGRGPGAAHASRGPSGHGPSIEHRPDSRGPGHFEHARQMPNMGHASHAGMKGERKSTPAKSSNADIEKKLDRVMKELEELSRRLKK